MASGPLANFAPVSFTAGICDLETSGGEGSLYRLADAALIWGKTHGRDVCWIYDPQIVPVPARQPAVAEVERSHALAALQALSRAIDAKDSLTREHSERVAALARRLALVSGWRAERVDQLESAGLVHDVGKIGVPDAILLKPGQLTVYEYEVVKQHAALGAQIVEGVLSGEQVEWVRSHHERPDGRGYPNGLMASSLSEGAGLLALADAFDAMTGPRAYGRQKDLDSAVQECHDLAGRQFVPGAVRALEAVFEKGLLTTARSG
jgi:HD-GYP domain-containing protein (c-di-GMP phosphodiesterase class II)